MFYFKKLVSADGKMLFLQNCGKAKSQKGDLWHIMEVNEMRDGEVDNRPRVTNKHKMNNEQ